MSNQGVSGGTGRIAAIGCAVIGGVLLLIVGGMGFLGIVGAGGAAWFLTARTESTEDQAIEERNAAEAVATAIEEAERAAAPIDAGQEATPEPAEPTQPAEVPATTTAASTTSTSTPTSAPSAESKATTTPKSTSAPATTSTTSTTSTSTTSTTSPPASTPAASAGSRVTTSGDGKVVLIGGTKRYPLPATMQPGTYSIEVTFSGEPPVTTGKVRVKEGEDIVITCKSAMGICRVN